MTNPSIPERVRRKAEEVTGAAAYLTAFPFDGGEGLCVNEYAGSFAHNGVNYGLYDRRIQVAARAVCHERAEELATAVFKALDSGGDENPIDLYGETVIARPRHTPVFNGEDDGNVYYIVNFVITSRA